MVSGAGAVVLGTLLVVDVVGAVCVTVCDVLVVAVVVVVVGASMGVADVDDGVDAGLAGLGSWKLMGIWEGGSTRRCSREYGHGGECNDVQGRCGMGRGRGRGGCRRSEGDAGGRESGEDSWGKPGAVCPRAVGAVGCVGAIHRGAGERRKGMGHVDRSVAVVQRRGHGHRGRAT